MSEPPRETAGISAGGERKARRETRDEIRNTLTIFVALIPVLGSALGFSPLARLWTAIPLLLGLVFVLVGTIRHDRGASVETDANTSDLSPRPVSGRVSRRRSSFARRAAIVAMIFGFGAWVGSSGRDALMLALHGTIGDLEITPAHDGNNPAVISVRNDSGSACFYSYGRFLVKNTTSSDLQVGVISSSLSMADDTNSPIFVSRSLNDVTASSGGVSGVALVKGTQDDWPKTVPQIKDQLTTLRRGASVGVTVYQNRDFNNNCVADQNGQFSKSYAASSISLSGEILTVFPDGNWKRENFNVTDPAKVIKG